MRPIALSLVLTSLVGATSSAQDSPAPNPFFRAGSFTLQGFVQNQTGVFIAPDKSATMEYRSEPQAPPTLFPSDHGDKLGKLSMLRNTLELAGEWRPNPRLLLRARFRGVLSYPLSVDREAQVPEPGYLTEPERRVRWVAERFYQEADLREWYVDWRPHDLVTLRVGKQLVAWGESGNQRLLDVVNPVDSTWHFSAFESFEDQRMPMVMVRMLLDVRPLDGGLDLVWVPMVPLIANEEDSVSPPLTFVGAWGLPMPPLQGDTSIMPQKIYRKVFMYPAQNPASSRVGACWRGQLGPVAYSLMYYYGHQLSPPIPDYYITKEGGENHVYVSFPRLHTAGLSLEYNLPFPVSTMLKFEGAVEPDRTYAPQSETGQTFEALTDGSTKTIFHPREKPTVTYALTIQQPAVLRFLNPEDVVVVALQFTHSFLPTFDKDEKLLEIPGYDSTLLTRHQFRLGGALFTSYLRGMMTPRIQWVWLFGYQGLLQGLDKATNLSSFKEVGYRDGGALLSASVRFAFGDHWRITVALNEFFGNDPYYGLGLFRDRDEVNLTVRYQF